MKNKLIEIEKIQNNIYTLWLNNPPVNAISTEFLFQLENSIQFTHGMYNMIELGLSQPLSHLAEQEHQRGRGTVEASPHPSPTPRFWTSSYLSHLDF